MFSQVVGLRWGGVGWGGVGWGGTHEFIIHRKPDFHHPVLHKILGFEHVEGRFCLIEEDPKMHKYIAYALFKAVPMRRVPFVLSGLSN